MKNLFLLRHAKSSWKDSALNDFDRPLNDRGRKAAELMGKVLAARKAGIELIVSSPAVRTRQTVERVVSSSMLAPEIRFDQRIYEASAVRLLEVLSQLDDERKSVMLVGHNPGLEELLALLTGVDQHMPTGSLAVLTLSFKKWEKIMSGRVILKEFIKPKELKSAEHEKPGASRKSPKTGARSG
jgi:phosphohistidine phosphatase